MVSLVQNKESTPNIVEKLFREACQALSEPSLSRDTSSFKVEYVGNSKDAEKILQRTLREFTYYVINNRYFGCQIMGFRILEGNNEEETCYSDEISISPGKQVNQSVLIRPGAYRKVTVELKVHNLAVNALLKSNQVNELEEGPIIARSAICYFKMTEKLLWLQMYIKLNAREVLDCKDFYIMNNLHNLSSDEIKMYL